MVEQRTDSRIATLTSPRNPLLKEVRRAIDKGTLTPSGLCVAESFHLLEEALSSQCNVPYVLASEAVAATVERKIKGLRSTTLLRLDDALFRSFSATESSQGVLALVEPPKWDLEAAFCGSSLVVILDGLQDPGNCGTILRAAEAFGATGALLLKGTVNPYNPKAIRASAGSLFRLPLVAALEAELVLSTARQRSVRMFSAMPRAPLAAADADLTGRCALVIGSEGQGVSAVMANAAAPLRIPTTRVESLNAAVAAGILLYEAARQRRTAD